MGRFAGFWFRALVTGGKLAGFLGGGLTLIFGGSAFAYAEAADHRARWVILGAVLAILVMMVAAYLQWHPVDRELTELKAEVARASVGGSHGRDIHGWLADLAGAVRAGRLSKLASEVTLSSRTIAAHFPDLVGPMGQWDEAVRRRDAAPGVAEDKIRRVLASATMPADDNAPTIIDAFTRCILSVGGPHRVDLPATHIGGVWKVDTPSGHRGVSVNVAEFADAPLEEIQERLKGDEQFFQQIVNGLDINQEFAEIRGLGMSWRPSGCRS